METNVTEMKNGSLLLSERVQLKRITISGLVSKHPSFLSSIVLTACSGCPATINIYNGQNTDGELVLSLNAGLEESFQYSFSIMQFFSRGIYVEVVTGCCVVMMQFVLKKDL